jgi:hypothetical protein
MSWRPAGREHPGEDTAMRGRRNEKNEEWFRRFDEGCNVECGCQPKEMDWLLFMAANCQWRPPAVDQRHNDVADSVDATREPPSTPEQPTRAISRLTQGKSATTCTGELSDTAIQPRALWGRDEGLSQEEALQMVAAHDAGALEDALSRGLAAIGAAAALLNWASSSLSALSRQRPPNIMKLAAIGKRTVRHAALTAALCNTLWKLRSPMAAALFNWEQEMIFGRYYPIWMLNDMGLGCLQQWQQRRLREHTATPSAFGPQLQGCNSGWRLHGTSSTRQTEQAQSMEQSKEQHRQPQRQTRQQQQQQQQIEPQNEPQNKQQNEQQNKQQNSQEQQLQQQTRQQHQHTLEAAEQAQNEQQNEPHTAPQNEQQNEQQNKQQNSQGQQPQQQARQQHQQQHHMRKAREARQQQQEWSPRPKPRPQGNRNREYLRRFEEHVGPQQWQQIINLSVKYEDPALNDVVDYWTIAGFKDEGTKRLVQDDFEKNKQQEVYKNTTSVRTLGANSPRAGDDWPD